MLLPVRQFATEKDNIMIRGFAAQLPIVVNKHKLTLMLKGKLIIEMGFKTDPFSGEPYKPELQYTFMPPVLNAEMHFRFIRMYFGTSGQSALTKYMEDVVAIAREANKNPALDPKQVDDYTDAEVIWFVKNVRKSTMFKEWWRHECEVVRVYLGMSKQHKVKDLPWLKRWRNRLQSLL